MTEIAAPTPIDQVDGDSPGPAETPTAQAGSALFPELVWAHYRYERRRHRTRKPDAEFDALEKDYLDKLKEFQENVGELDQVYWSTKGASAVGMTVKHDGEER